MKLPPAASQGRLEARNNCRSNFTEISLRPLSVTDADATILPAPPISQTSGSEAARWPSVWSFGSGSYNQKPNRATAVKREPLPIPLPTKRTNYRFRVAAADQWLSARDSHRQRGRKRPPPRNQRPLTGAASEEIDCPLPAAPALTAKMHESPLVQLESGRDSSNDPGRGKRRRSLAIHSGSDWMIVGMAAAIRPGQFVMVRSALEEDIRSLAGPTVRPL